MEMNDVDAGSQDLFSSQDMSQGTNINEQIDITLQLTEFVWVQCDHPNCQKWRRIPSANADDLGEDPWYCSMNPDPVHNSCDAKEEDHRRYDRMAKKVGVKFVMSVLNIGTLVWAKMPGYCRWPGIVTPDPMTGVHIHLDIDGDPHSYHIEYLGNPHTHSWVVAKYVEVYGHKEEPEEIIDRELNKIRRKKGVKKTKNNNPQMKRSYRRVRVEDVMREADYLLPMTYDERMRFCLFRYDPKADVEPTGCNENVPLSASGQRRCHNCGEDPLKKKKLKQKVQENSQGIQNLLNFREKYALAKNAEKRKKKYSTTKATQKNESTNDVLYSPTREVSMVELSAGTQIKDLSDSTRNIIDSPNQFSQSKLKISSSMINKTKEEKFKVDIDVYLKNEKAFEHDVRRFMTRNDRTIRASPFWHNVPVSLFQLFLAVHERGGFQKVCETKAWTRVYKELTDMQHVTTGSVAKHYYERNLYPYELFITGQDFTKALEKFSLKPRVKKTKNVESVIKQEHGVNNNADNGTSDYASYCSDIEAILGQLEDDYKATLSGDDSKTEMKKKIGVSLTFHDETPSSPSLKFASVPSEFDQKATDLASNTLAVQQVPEVTLKDDELNLDEVEDKILTEMKALEDQMREMHDEIDELI